MNILFFCWFWVRFVCYPVWICLIGLPSSTRRPKAAIKSVSLLETGEIPYGMKSLRDEIHCGG